jgi:hypothetical protein
MSTWISSKAFGTFSQKGDRLKVWKRAKNASMKRKWVTSKKVRPISKRAAMRLQRP